MLLEDSPRRTQGSKGDRTMTTARHIHKVVRDEDGELVASIDLCECGNDIRDEIHFRLNEQDKASRYPDNEYYAGAGQ